MRNVELAIERVKVRVKEGGHNILSDIIERRFLAGIDNLFSIYISIVDELLIIDNSEDTFEIIAESKQKNQLIINNESKFNEFKKYAKL